MKFLSWHAVVIELSTDSKILCSCNDAFKVKSGHKEFSETANICRNLAVRIPTCNYIGKTQTFADTQQQPQRNQLIADGHVVVSINYDTLETAVTGSLANILLLLKLLVDDLCDTYVLRAPDICHAEALLLIVSRHLLSQDNSGREYYVRPHCHVTDFAIHAP